MKITIKEARAAGLRYAVHVLNQPDKADNGWHYFATYEEAAQWREEHPDPRNTTTIDRI